MAKKGCLGCLGFIIALLVLGGIIGAIVVATITIHQPLPPQTKQ